MPGQASDDPHWDRVVEIAANLWINGEYVVDIDPCPTQDLVDLQWAAHQAGRVLGGRARIATRAPGWPGDLTVRMTVTYVDPDGTGGQRAEAGLDELLRRVLADQTRRDR